MDNIKDASLLMYVHIKMWVLNVFMSSNMLLILNVEMLMSDNRETYWIYRSWMGGQHQTICQFLLNGTMWIWSAYAAWEKMN
ncbi:MAG: hypothetical protein CM1200mP3_01730 [Chloroflexota bacterium]|nr:MAG: hypothetical protein CM1200mP3_01730 [Chloroflexota bacterium]